jgi:hypothetical protein
MGRRRLVGVTLAVACVVTSGPAAAVAAGSQDKGPVAVRLEAVSGSWNRAIEVPGMSALDAQGGADLSSVSCASAGNCAAGGYYRSRVGGRQGFLVSEKNGRWSKAIEVPGLAALNTRGNAGVISVSCAAAGSCAAGGTYLDGHRHRQGFLVNEKNGRWGRAIEVPGLGALNKDGKAGVISVSCASAGNCVAAGYYKDGDDLRQASIDVERRGRWGQAFEVPGLAALNAGDASVGSVSCSSAGNCAVGGYFSDGHGHRLGFVVSEMSGQWGQAIEVPGLGALSDDRNSQVLSMSCTSGGNCAAAGYYRGHGFVVSENDGLWGQAVEVPGLAALGGHASVSSVSCGSAGNCVAGGDYGSPYQWGYVVTEKDGIWGRAIKVPGLGALTSGRHAAVNSVSCTPAGYCAAGGDYQVPHGSKGFLISEKNGTWGRAAKVPGLSSLDKAGHAAVNSVSCTQASSCMAGGSYAAGGSSGSPLFSVFVT